MSQNSGRNANLELLRIICMFGIVYSHLSGYAGIDMARTTFENGNVLIAVLRTVFNPMVNVFVLISGYFLIKADFRLERIVKTYTVPLFYLLIGTTIAFVFGNASIVDFIRSLLFIIPSRVGGLWFIRMYIMLLLIQPYLQIWVNNLSHKQYILLLALLLFMNTHILENFPLGNIHMDGFSNFWFITVFLLGGYIRRHVDIGSINTSRLLAIVLSLGGGHFQYLDFQDSTD